MAVTFENSFETHGSAVTSLPITMTVSDRPYRALVAMLLTSNTISADTMTWDNNNKKQLCAQLATKQNTVQANLYGLLNPTPGTLVLNAAWTTSASDVYLAGVVLLGVDQTSTAVSFPSAWVNNGTGSPSVAIAGSQGTNMTIAAASSTTNFSAPTQTALFTDNQGGNSAAAASRAAGPAAGNSSVVHAWTSTGTWAAAGVDVLAASVTSFTAIPGPGGIVIRPRAS